MPDLVPKNTMDLRTSANNSIMDKSSSSPTTNSQYQRDEVLSTQTSIVKNKNHFDQYFPKNDNLLLQDYVIPNRLMKPKAIQQSFKSSFYLPSSNLSTTISTQNAHLVKLGRDTSLNNATNEIRRRWNRYKKMQNDLISLKASQCDIVKKQLLLKQIKIQLPHLNLSDLNVLHMTGNDLEQFYYKELFKLKQTYAAEKIQSIYKMYKDRKKYLNIQKERLEATQKIKNMWKKCRWHRLVRQMVQQRKHEAAMRIKTYLVGFLAKKQVKQELANKKLQESMQYFEKKKLEIQTDAQVKICYYWRRYKKEQEVIRKNILEAQLRGNLSMDKNSKGRRKYTKGDIYQKPGPSWGYSKLRSQKTQNMKS
ncbi:UNKNOWN [Stylonychia lemnae]|uniref:Uncharacterized protein n=1 Tax=Stylonychia lemnae TaxID=5949 RepID=A0A078A3X4_STYLE|nr:UNKNOWN [Stylonychia lemnae]|eukprot:CDW76574.1 UNKNOWN [Stylonychia lemnae]